MSSRLEHAEDALHIEPVTWREVGPEGAGEGFGEQGMPGSAGGIFDPERRVAQRIREAHEAGRREGEAAVQSRAAAELQPVIERLSRSIAEIGGLRARLRREAEKDLIRLALAIAHRILRREVAVDPDALHGLALGALERLQGQEIARARVHPAHAALVTACLRQMTTGSAVEVVADPSCQPGTVIFETERGNLDASVESQLQEIERGLVDRFRKNA